MAVHAGSWFGLPDLGITEAIQKIIAPNKPLTAQGGSNLFGKTTIAAPAPSPKPTGTSTQGITTQATTSKVPTSTTPSQPNQQTQNFNPDQNAQDTANAEAAARAAEESRVRGAISSEFDPIFTELDRRIGMLPDERKQMEDQIGGLAKSQADTTTTQQTRDLASLDTSKSGEVTQAQGSLRDLESDVRNQLLAKSFYFGALGAGDSSAPGMASEAVTKGALKARSNVLATRDQALAVIDQKKGDVNSLATDQLQKIDQWKSDKLFSTAQFYSQKLDDLNGQKATAQGEKAKAISNMIQGLSQQFLTRLTQLDDQVTSFKQGVAQWQMQRQGDLEDFQKKLDISAAYSSTSQPTQSDILNNFSKIYGTGALTVDQARQLATGASDLTGLQLTPEQAAQKKQSTADQLLEQAAQQSGGVGALLGL